MPLALPLHDATACTGEGCPRASDCERHLLMQRRREHIAAGGTPAPWSQMAPPPGAAENCDLWIETPCT